MVPVRLSIDTVVWIRAAERGDAESLAMLALAATGQVELCVSSHVLTELEASVQRFGSSSFDLAKRARVLPCYPTGTYADLAGTYDGLAGTFDDIGETDDFRMQLGSIVTEGTGLRDRGALVDSIRAAVDWFVTFDKGIVGSGPMKCPSFRGQ